MVLLLLSSGSRIEGGPTMWPAQCFFFTFFLEIVVSASYILFSRCVIGRRYDVDFGKCCIPRLLAWPYKTSPPHIHISSA